VTAGPSPTAGRRLRGRSRDEGDRGERGFPHKLATRPPTRRGAACQRSESRVRRISVPTVALVPDAQAVATSSSLLLHGKPGVQSAGVCGSTATRRARTGSSGTRRPRLSACAAGPAQQLRGIAVTSSRDATRSHS
jgi:hypothetical protein